MSPCYVRYHPAVLGARLERSGWDGSLAGGVTVVSAWPEEIKTAAARSVRLGDRDAYWQDWPPEFRGGETVSYFEPGEADVAARPYLLAPLSFPFQGGSAALPVPPPHSTGLLRGG